MKTQVFTPNIRQEFKKILSETVESLLERRIPQIIRRANCKEYLTTAGQFFERLFPSSNIISDPKRKSPIQSPKNFYRIEDVEKIMEERRLSSHK